VPVFFVAVLVAMKDMAKFNSGWIRTRREPDVVVQKR
jgi:hypothetical protein